MKVKYMLILTFALIPIQYYLLKCAHQNSLISENQFSFLSISFGVILFTFGTSLAGASSTMTANEPPPSNGQNESSFIDRTLNSDSAVVIKKATSEIYSSFANPFIIIYEKSKKVLNWIQFVNNIINVAIQLKNIVFSFPINSFFQFKNWCTSAYNFIKSIVIPLFTKNKTRVTQ